MFSFWCSRQGSLPLHGQYTFWIYSSAGRIYLKSSSTLARSLSLHERYRLSIFLFASSINTRQPLRLLTYMLPACTARAPTKMAPRRVLVFVLVLSPGVEPGAPVPQTEILSIKLREQARNKMKVHFHFGSERSSRPRRRQPAGIVELRRIIH